MAISVVQFVANFNPNGSSVNLVLPGAPTPGNKLIACTGQRDELATNTVSGFTLAIRQDPTNIYAWPDCWIYYRDVVGGDGTTWSFSSTSRARCVLMEVSGLASGGPAATAVASPFGNGNGVAITSAGFVVAAIGNRGGSNTSLTGANGFTNPGGAGYCEGGLSPHVGAIYKVATGSQTPAFTVDSDYNQVGMAEATWAEFVPVGRSQGIII